ncbi:hypothetical protein P3X46_032273 [Hevea brasiliensis]|uniref:Uncharacterized protein n=1 Tax=Hevea brasiliensis TaxID=3981 RepID=A0ABQ9KCT2_HEVBR|nr:hypothetical protein P3X46_032273 [Hevea brasiliensis]
MSLNFLTCQDLHRNDSGTEYDGEKAYRKICCIEVERSWSGNLGQPYKKIGKSSMVITRKIRKNHHCLNNTGTMEFEGSGEGRGDLDWSFEDLRQCGEDRKKQRR